MNKILVTLGAGVFAALFAFAPAAGSPANSVAAARAQAMHTRMENR